MGLMAVLNAATLTDNLAMAGIHVYLGALFIGKIMQSEYVHAAEGCGG